VWRKLARLVRCLNWDGEIDVENVDGTRNKVYVEGMDARNFPAAYFFLNGRRERPVELTVDGYGGVRRGRLVRWWM